MLNLNLKEFLKDYSCCDGMWNALMTQRIVLTTCGNVQDLALYQLDRKYLNSVIKFCPFCGKPIQAKIYWPIKEEELRK